MDDSLLFSVIQFHHPSGIAHGCRLGPRSQSTPKGIGLPGRWTASLHQLETAPIAAAETQLSQKGKAYSCRLGPRTQSTPKGIGLPGRWTASLHQLETAAVAAASAKTQLSQKGKAYSCRLGPRTQSTPKGNWPPRCIPSPTGDCCRRCRRNTTLTMTRGTYERG
jgi:hypothetical protein